MPETKKNILKTRVGRSVTISLAVNKTTGFSWEIDSCDSELRCTELEYRKHLGGLGAGGEQRFEVDTPQPGTFEIRFRLKRPWEEKAKEVRTYRVVAEDK